MSTDDSRTRKLGLLERLCARFGKCPDCGSRLSREVLAELVDSWSYTMPKYTARTLGNRAAPSSHVTEAPKCWIVRNAIDGIRAHGRIGRIPREIDKCYQAFIILFEFLQQLTRHDL